MTPPPPDGKPLRKSRAFVLSHAALGYGFVIVLLGFGLSLKGKLTTEFVSLAAGFGVIASVALTGTHWTNVQERKNQ